MDHAVEGPEYTELEDPRELVHRLAEAGADGFIMRRGLARLTAASFAGRSGLVVRVTGRSGLSHRDAEQLFIASPEEALRSGADAVVYTIFLGINEDRDLPLIGQVTDTCHRIGLPVMGEIFPIGDERAAPYDGPYTVEDMRVAVRVACEEGADMIKTWYTGDPRSFAKVVAYATVPVLIAGGPKAERVVDILEMVKGAMDAGAKGVTMGRKIWQSPDPAATLHAIARIVREGADVDQALAVLA